MSVPVVATARPQAITEGATSTGGRRLPSLEIASGIEGQHELLPALVPDKRIVTLHEFRDSFRGPRAMAAIHRVTVEICVFDDKVASQRDQQRVRVQLRQDVLFSVARVEDDQDAGRAFGSPADLAQDPL